MYTIIMSYKGVEMTIKHVIARCNDDVFDEVQKYLSPYADWNVLSVILEK